MCTAITMTANNGDVVTGRTQEFGNYYLNDAVVIPRNFKYTNSAIFGGKTEFTTKYAILGENAGEVVPGVKFNELIADGLNEKGLSYSLLYYPGCATYKYVDTVADEQMDITMMGLHLLANFANVDEVAAYIETENEKETFVMVEKLDEPVHFMMVDRSGKSIVIEPDVPGKLIVKIADGIMTNSPGYEWHVANLKATTNIQQFDTNHSVLVDPEGNSYTSHGTSGAFGLPGDTSPGSRFIRANYLRATATKKTLHTADETVLRLLRIFNLFDIVPGMALKELPKSGATTGEVPKEITSNVVETDIENTVAGHTDHTLVKDLTNLKMYYKDWANQSIRMVDLNDYMDATEIKSIKMVEDESMPVQKVELK